MSNKVEEINNRMYNRNVPNFKPQVFLDSRPVPTKYTLFNTTDQPNTDATPILSRSLFNHQSHFLPGSTAPVSTKLNNIDHESYLRNQFFALQKCDRAFYVPSSNSDMYSVEVVGRKEKSTHPLLFKDTTNELKTHNNITKDKMLMYNSSRLRE